MKYYTEHTGYAGAIDCLEKIGGQLFPCKRRDGVSTVVAGKSCYSFWEPNSKNYAKCKQVAEDFNFPHEHFTPGRVSKHLLEAIIGIDPKLGTPDRRFIQLAQDGFHWHYTYVEPGYHPYLLEFDLCAAYVTSLAKYESLYFAMNQRMIPDGGAIENLRALLPSIPKWIRLVMVGQLASHRMTFATMPNRKAKDYSMKWTTIRKIGYGYAFNRAHQAILRVHRLLQRIHQIGGDSIKRIHTDSFALQVNCPIDVEREIFEYLDSQGFSYSCKAQGSSHFFDLNSGIIGRKFVGVPMEIRDCLRRLPEKPKRHLITPEQLERWGVRGVGDDSRQNQEVSPAAEQLPIEGLGSYERTGGSVFERFA